ncbi:hypothetical protein F4X33_05185 [Candidatus Poribacteria bacterium]|nr:hypothetical protein [Candidatus Poribacteria bacterium]
MQNLLLVLAILMLGCGTDTEVIEDPAPVAEEPASIKEEILLVAEEPVSKEPSPVVDDNLGHADPPHIARSNVGPEQFPRDPVPLNQDGIFFEFDEDLALFKADITLDGQSLGWFPRNPLRGDDVGVFAKLTPPADGPFLEYNKEYVIDLLAVDNGNNHTVGEITFQTIPRP